MKLAAFVYWLFLRDGGEWFLFFFLFEAIFIYAASYELRMEQTYEIFGNHYSAANDDNRRIIFENNQKCRCYWRCLLSSFESLTLLYLVNGSKSNLSWNLFINWVRIYRCQLIDSANHIPDFQNSNIRASNIYGSFGIIIQICSIKIFSILYKPIVAMAPIVLYHFAPRWHPLSYLNL